MSTPSSGASTVAPLQRELLEAQARRGGAAAAHAKTSGAAVVSSDPRIVDAVAAGALTSSAAVARRRGRRVMPLPAQHLSDWISAGQGSTWARVYVGRKRHARQAEGDVRGGGHRYRDARIVPTWTGRAPKSAEAERGARNVIVLQGDGMGTAQRDLIRLVTAGNTPGKELVMNRLDHAGLVHTDPADPKQAVTDSAAAATAFSTGVKTFNGAVGVDVDGSPRARCSRTRGGRARRPGS